MIELDGPGERFGCAARPHGRLWNGRKVISIRCKDPACPDAVYAEMSQQICVHYWDIDDPDLRMWSEFEQNPVKATEKGR